MKRLTKKITMVSVVLLSAGMAFAAVSEDEAINTALSDAGVEISEATALRSHKDRDDGRAYYDIEFRSDEGKWEYEIDAESGRIVGFDFEESRNRAPASVGVDRAEAERIALSDAGFDRDEVSRFRMESDRDDGIAIYEISFVADNIEYDYDINADDGTIIKASWEKKGRISGDREARLAESEAEAIAYDVLGEDAERLSVWEDWDDGRYWYEAEATIGDYRYEADITGSGEVVSVSRELRAFWR